MQAVDSIGVVRETKRLRAPGQVKRLQEDGCRVIFEIGSKAKQYSRDDLEGLVRLGTMVKLVHVYLLADPRAKRKKGGCRADLLAVMKRIEKRGGTIKDVDSGLDTSDPEHRYDIIAMAADQIARGGRVRRNGLGRPARTWTDAEWEKARTAWDSRRLKTWREVKAHLPKGMSLHKAWEKFGPRTKP